MMTGSQAMVGRTLTALMVALAVPTVAVAGDPVPMDDAAPAAAAPVSTKPESVTIRPAIANAFDRRDDYVSRQTGAPDAATSYVERVPRSFGVTLRAPL